MSKKLVFVSTLFTILIFAGGLTFYFIDQQNKAQNDVSANSNVSSISTSSLPNSQNTVSAPNSSTSNNNSSTNPVGSTNENEYDTAKLSEFNGLNGNKCYVAVDGKVYDLTGNPEWKNGVHQASGGRAKCGTDGSAVMKQSPHGMSALRGIAVVGSFQ